MKTFRLIGMALLAVVMSFASCSSDDDNEEEEKNQPTFLTINLPTAGELPNITERRDFKALKLTGYLNGTDIKAIREMEELEYLDISETHIVAGGEHYYVNEYDDKFFTADNEISDYMFYHRSKLKQIFLPNNVTSIGENAFCDCNGLTSIDIPNSVTKIGRGAFAYCCSSTSINIPNRVTTIREYAFYYCGNLTSINIPDGVTTIGEWAFYNCGNLTSINIPDGVTTIGERAFCDCNGLTSIDIPNSVKAIGFQAFYGCNNLTAIKIGTGLTSIESICLLTHASITEVHCYATKVPTSNDSDFYINKSNAKLYIPKGTYQAYYLSNWGKAFTNIIEMEE